MTLASFIEKLDEIEKLYFKNNGGWKEKIVLAARIMFMSKTLTPELIKIKRRAKLLEIILGMLLFTRNSSSLSVLTFDSMSSLTFIQDIPNSLYSHLRDPLIFILDINLTTLQYEFSCLNSSRNSEIRISPHKTSLLLDLILLNEHGQKY